MSRWPFRRTLPPGAARADDSADIQEELELYLQLRTEELVAGGMEPAAARREAEARFGNRADIERRMKRAAPTGRRGGGTMTFAQLKQDLAYAVRTMRRNPGFTLVAALTLAVAIAGNTAIFTVLDAAVLRALPFPDHDRLVFLNGYHLQDGQQAIRNASIPEFRDWRERSRTIDPMVAVAGGSLTWTGEGEATVLTGEFVSEGFFDIVGAEAVLGRTFTAEEAATPDGYPLALLSHGLWQSRFGGDPGVLGRTLQIADRPLTVLGVMPEGFEGINFGVDVWLPFGMFTLVAPPQVFDSRGSRFLPAVGRLATGATVEDAQAEMDAISRDLQELYPRAHEDRFARVESFREGYLGTTGRMLWVLFGAGGLLLLIAAANVANLLLVRANARTRELVVRRAIGAGGRRIGSQLITESLVLALVGGLAGVVLAAWGLGVVVPLIPQGVLPAYASPAVSGRAFGLTLGALAVVGVLAGLAPARSSARRDLGAALRVGGRGASGSRSRTQQVFVVTQVALALLLLFGAGLLTRSFQAQLAIDPGLEMEGIHAFRLSAPRERYPDAASLRTFVDEILAAVGSVPGVSSVAASSDFPLRGGSSGAYIYRPDDPETRIRYHRHSVTPGYFANLGVELLAGRSFEASDDEDAPGVAVVTQALIDRVFPDVVGGGLGQTLYIGDPSDAENLVEIVGVVENVRYRNLTQDMMDEPNSPDVFFAVRQIPSRGYDVSYKVAGDGASVASAVRAAVRSVDGGIPVQGMTSLRELYLAQTAQPRFAAFLMGLFSTLALILACVGIYGVLAFTVGQRGPEIAVRRALGAKAGDVARSVVLDGLRLTGAGLVIGGVVSLMGGRLLESLLFNVQTTDPQTLAAVTTAMVLVAILAAAIPAWRATLKDPADALGAE